MTLHEPISANFRMSRICYQVNLQTSIGGGEVYTRFLTHALSRLGWRTVMLVAERAGFWPTFMNDNGQQNGAGIEFRAISDDASLLARLPAEPGLIVTHSVLSEALAPPVSARHCLTGFAHMPLHDRKPRGLAAYRRVFAVSEYVRQSALSCGLKNVHHEPLYGVADVASRLDGARVISPGIHKRSVYDWDTRKLRDRLLGWIESSLPESEQKVFSRLPGLTLGIVSRLTPIKQFPLMFSILSPVLARHSNVHLEIFGSGGYGSVRDLKEALAPIRGQVRFWGHQTDVAPIYRELDYVISGLPEKEALGLNLIEAQSCGTPVLAIDAPPFTETVAEGKGGFLFKDPRRDGGADLARLISRLETGSLVRPDPHDDLTHLSRFSQEEFDKRLNAALNGLEREI